MSIIYGFEGLIAVFFLFLIGFQIVTSSKGGDVCSKGCIPHVTERRFEVRTWLVV